MSMPLIGTAFAAPISHRFYANALLFRVGAAIAEPKIKKLCQCFARLQTIYFVYKCQDGAKTTNLGYIESSNTSFFVANYCLNLPF